MTIRFVISRSIPVHIDWTSINRFFWVSPTPRTPCDPIRESWSERLTDHPWSATALQIRLCFGVDLLRITSFLGNLWVVVLQNHLFICFNASSWVSVVQTKVFHRHSRWAERQTFVSYIGSRLTAAPTLDPPPGAWQSAPNPQIVPQNPFTWQGPSNKQTQSKASKPLSLRVETLALSWVRICVVMCYVSARY